MKGQSKTEEKAEAEAAGPGIEEGTLEDYVDSVKTEATGKGLIHFIDWDTQTLNAQQKKAFSDVVNAETRELMWLSGAGKNVRGEDGIIPDRFVQRQRVMYEGALMKIVLGGLNGKQRTTVRNRSNNDLQQTYHSVKFFFVPKTPEGKLKADQNLREWPWERKMSFAENFAVLRDLFVKSKAMEGNGTERLLLEMIVGKVPNSGTVALEIKIIKDAMKAGGELPTWADTTHALESAQTADVEEEKARSKHKKQLQKEEDSDEEEGDAEESSEANIAKEMRKPSVRLAIREAYEQGQQSAMSAKYEETCAHCNKPGHTKKVCWALNPHLNPRSRGQASSEECYNWRDTKSCKFGAKCRWAKSHN
jgi:hypothetical protein